MRLILSISLIVITVLLFFLVVDPLYGQVKQLKSEVSTYNVALDNSTELQKTRDSLIDIYKNVKEGDKERLEHFLPSTIGNIELILEIEKIANLHGMPIKNIKFEAKNLANQAKAAANNPTSGTDEDMGVSNVIVAEVNPSDNLPYGVFPMEFIIEGRYDTFLSFLNDLEHNLRLVDVKSISFMVPSPVLNAEGKTTNPNVYSFTLKVETYWLK
jgi:hypothetical protein